MSINPSDRRRLSKLLSDSENRRTGRNTGGGSMRRAESVDSLCIVITTELIEPNTYGSFKFTTGAKGSESVTGDEYQGWYRAEETDPPDLPSGTKCFAMWVACDTLTGTQTGWELTPVACIDA